MSELLKVQTYGRIIKVNAKDQTVEGIGADETPDSDGEIFDYEGSKPYIEAWSTKQADTTKSAGQEISYGNIRGQHDAKVAAGRVAQPIDFDDKGKSVGLKTKIVDKDEFQKCLEGVYTGFSVKGRSVKKWRDGAHMRYIVDPVEFSLVDVPCNPGATFTVVKADGSSEDHKFLISDGWDDIIKRKFSAEDRKKLADSGKALPDGSFPIENKEDLENAIHAYGRAKDKTAAKKHIIARAKSLGATDMLPEDWTSTKKSADGDVYEIQGVRRFHEEPVEEFVERAVSTLVSKAAETQPKPAAKEKSMKTDQQNEVVEKVSASEKMKLARKAHNDVGPCVGGYCDHNDASKCMEKAADAHKHIAAAFEDEGEAEKAAKAKESEDKKDGEESEEEKKKKSAKKDDEKKDDEKEKAAGSDLDEVKKQIASLTELVTKMAEQPGTQRNKPVVNGTVVEKLADASKGKDDKGKAADIDPNDPDRVEKALKNIHAGELELVKL